MLWHLIVKRARAEGFLVFDYVQRYREAQEQIAKWIGAGKVQYRETIVDGLENAPRAFIGLFRGENLGKQLVVWRSRERACQFRPFCGNA